MPKNNYSFLFEISNINFIFILKEYKETKVMEAPGQKVNMEDVFSAKKRV
jgi:hypothetical protein